MSKIPNIKIIGALLAWFAICAFIFVLLTKKQTSLNKEKIPYHEAAIVIRGMESHTDDPLQKKAFDEAARYIDRK